MSTTPTEPTPTDALAEFTPNESQTPSYAELTSAQRQVLILEKVDVLNARLDSYDHLLEHGMESVNTVMEAAENNPMIRNLLGL